jgi:hypothetical protein
MSKWSMRGHFQYLRFKTFPMTPRTPQCKVFWAFLSNSKHSGVLEDSKSSLFQVLGFTPTLGQNRVATYVHEFFWFNKALETKKCIWIFILFSKLLLNSPYYKASTQHTQQIKCRMVFDVF